MSAVERNGQMDLRKSADRQPDGLALADNEQAMKPLATSSAVLLIAPVWAQNLVPNGSFEEYTDCPDYWDQLGGNVTGWSVCSPSPDYFNACRDSSDFDVPFNWRGYQGASHGRGYSGVGTYQWNSPNFREFICAELLQPLVPGVPVDLSMKVALGGFGSNWLYSPRWTTRGIGMLLTTQPLEWSTGSSYPNTAQLYLDSVFMDTTNWALLSTTYIPDSAYHYVTLGNFFEDSLSAPTLLDTAFGNANAAYVYIDEVCIALTGMACDFVDAIGSLSTIPWRITSPFSERLEIGFGKALDQTTELILCDTDGRLVARRIAGSGAEQLVWPVYGLANGVYILRASGNAVGLKPTPVLHVSP